MPSLHNRVARRIAFRGTLPKLFLGFGIMAVLLFALSALDFGPGSTKSPGSPDAGTSAQAPANATTQQSSAIEAAPGSADTAAAKRPFPKSGARKESSTPSTSPLQALLIAILMLGGLVAVLFFAARFLKKARLIPAKRNERLQLEDVLSLGPKKSLHVVRFENRTLVLASAETGVQLIADYAAEELVSNAVTSVATEETNLREVSTAPAASPAPAASATEKAPVRVTPRVSRSAESAVPSAGAERVPAAFRHLLRREQGLELEA